MRARDVERSSIGDPGMTAPRARGFTAGTGVPMMINGRLPDLALTSCSPSRPQPGMEARQPTRVPSLSRRHVPRPRLTRVLEASTAQTILLIAPAGFGKTSLACEWLAGRENVFWYRATSASADLAAFSVGIAEVLAPVAPGAAERLRQRLRVGEVPEKAARPLAEMLADDLVDWPSDGILVIDDYHLVVDSAPVEEFVDWLLTRASHLRVLVTSRRRPAWASARRVLYGQVTEIESDRLAMTDREVSAALAERPREAVRTLVSQADGWPPWLVSPALPQRRRFLPSMSHASCSATWPTRSFAKRAKRSRTSCWSQRFHIWSTSRSHAMFLDLRM